MTEPVWQAPGFRLRKTTDPNLLFIDVDPRIRHVVQPFMEAAETQYPVIWNPKAEGWLIPTSDQQIFINFLSVVEDFFAGPMNSTVSPLGGMALVPSPPPLIADQEEGFESGLIPLVEYSSRRNRATVWWLNNVSTLALISLFNITKAQLDPEYIESLKSLFNDEIFKERSWDVKLDSEPVELLQSPEFLAYVSDFFSALQEIQSQVSSEPTPVVKRGDLLKYIFNAESNDVTSIFDGVKFVGLLREDETTEFGSIPRQFIVPEPFPITWWEGLLRNSSRGNAKVVWPNFDYLGEADIEFMAEPPRITLLQISLEFEVDDQYVALRFTFPSGKVYYIYYCVPADSPPLRFDKVDVLFKQHFKQFNSEEPIRPMYFAYNDQIILTPVEV